MGTKHARVTGIAAIAFAALVLFAPHADANARVCRQIEAQLASGGQGGGGGAQFRKYDRAVTTQRNELKKARSNARAAGCAGFSLFGGRQCGNVQAKIAKMERNLDMLERKREQLSGGGGISRRERARLLAALDQNDCRGERTASARPRERELRNGGSLFDQLFGGNVRRSPGLDETVERGMYSDDGTGHYGMAGNFRTLCVRTCDGYYFPMSSNSSGRDFQRDQANCESMCPGTEVQLYYHDAGGEGSDEMMSVATQQPYSALSTAYQYKQLDVKTPEGCGCNAVKTREASNFQVLGGTSENADAEPTTPMPTARPDPGTDPETVKNRAGGLDQAAVARLLAPKPTGPVAEADPENRKVRVVGPEFLPDQAGAIDLRAPDRKNVQ